MEVFKLQKRWLTLLLSVLLAISAAPIQAHAQDSQTIAKIVNSVNFREKPALSGDRIRYLRKGEIVTVLDKINAYWYKVKDRNGTVGYVSSNSKYISTAGSSGSGSSSGSSSGSGSGDNVSAQAQKVISAGKKYMGTPYEFNSSRSNTSTFDCSDFVRQAFLDGIGKRLPADSRAQGTYVKNNSNTTTNWKRLKPGDLMFFMAYKGPKASSYEGINKSSQRISHVAIYLGDGKILHTYSTTSGGVRIDSIDGRHWESRFIFGGSAI